MKTLILLFAAVAVFNLGIAEAVGGPGVIPSWADVALEWEAAAAVDVLPKDIRYNLRQSTLAGIFGDPPVIIDGPATTHTIENLANGTYYFRLSAFTVYNTTEAFYDDFTLVVSTAPATIPNPGSFRAWVIKLIAWFKELFNGGTA